MAGANATSIRLGVALDPDKFRLDATEHQAIFEQKIKPRLFGGTRPASKPVAVIFGGQPGAGKSAVVGLAHQELAQRGGAVEIIGDDLRQFHPHYGRLVGLDDMAQVGCTLDDVVRVNYVLPDGSDFEPCWPVLRQHFGKAKPAAMVITAGLLDPHMKIEIEVTALKATA